nr:F-box/FBD/LRR-repeat protein At1g13570-like isoform X3 [Erigeron canadensis]
MLSQLVFDEKFFKDVFGAPGTDSYDWRNVIKFLLSLRGSITKFTLRLPKDMVFDVEDINHWFLFLSGKEIKDVSLINMHETPLKLPDHLFSCLELKCLEIRDCYFCPPLSFRGFPNLLKLNLLRVHFESYKFGELVTCCPVLEILGNYVDGLLGKVKAVEIAQLDNLKSLSMSLSNLDTGTLTSSSIFQLVGSFSKLQEVILVFLNCKLLAEAGATKGITTTFPCLEILRLWSVDCNKDIEVSLVLKMICCSPKLQKLQIVGTYENDVPPIAPCSSDFNDNTMWRSQLRSVVFACSKGSKSEIYLIKTLLACSPLLKKIAIGLNTSLMVDGADGRLQFAEKLLKLHRASTMAEIDLFYFSNWDSSVPYYYW